MLLRNTIVKLVVFAIISVVGVSYAAWRYAGGDDLIGKRTYPVRVQLANGGGIFENGEVTYRGVKVGQIERTLLRQDGVEVEIEIQNSAPPIPADTMAVVANRSAVGEQYIDLRPRTTSGPYLADVPEGRRVIEQRDTAVPPPVQDLITRVNDLATSVPTDSLRTVVDELDQGLAGTGSDLQRLLDTTSSFTTAANRNFGPTKQLIDTGQTVLETQNDTAGALRSFSSDLRGIAATLRDSDPDIRRLITATPQAARQVTAVLNENATNLGSLLANLVTTSGMLASRDAGLRQLLSSYPLAPGAAASALPGDGTAHIGLALNLFDPFSCERGYQGTRQRPGQGDGALTEIPANADAYCAEPRGSPTSVRGSQNAPVAGQPFTAASPAAPSTSAGTRAGPNGGLFAGFDLGPSLSEILRTGG